MSLRNTLRHATELRVAPLYKRNTQLSDVKSATGGATASQLPTANPHECWSSSATGSATPAQLAGFEPRNTTEEQEKLRVALVCTRNTQLGGLTAHRLPAALVSAIGRCCDARGDDDLTDAGRNRGGPRQDPRGPEQEREVRSMTRNALRHSDRRLDQAYPQGVESDRQSRCSA